MIEQILATCLIVVLASGLVIWNVYKQLKPVQDTSCAGCGGECSATAIKKRVDSIN